MDGLVDRAGEAAVLLIEDLPARWKLSAHDRCGIVVRSVVDVNELDVLVCLLLDSFQAAAQKRSIVPGD